MESIDEMELRCRDGTSIETSNGPEPARVYTGDSNVVRLPAPQLESKATLSDLPDIMIRIKEINKSKVEDREGLISIINSTPSDILDRVVNKYMFESEAVSEEQMLIAESEWLPFKDYYFLHEGKLISDHRPQIKEVGCLRVMTFNVMKIHDYVKDDSKRYHIDVPTEHLLDTGTKYTVITDVIRNSEANVVCLQECDYMLYNHLFDRLHDYRIRFIPLRVKFGNHGNGKHGTWFQESGMCILTNRVVELDLHAYTGNSGYTNGINVRNVRIVDVESGINIVASHNRLKTSKDCMSIIGETVHDCKRTAIAGDLNMNISELMLELKDFDVGVFHDNVMTIADVSNPAYEYRNSRCLDHIRRVSMMKIISNDVVLRDCDAVKAFVFYHEYIRGHKYIDVQIVGVVSGCKYMNCLICGVECNVGSIKVGSYIQMNKRSEKFWNFSPI